MVITSKTTSPLGLRVREGFKYKRQEKGLPFLEEITSNWGDGRSNVQNPLCGTEQDELKVGGKMFNRINPVMGWVNVQRVPGISP
eukprot:5049737-Amphidinium_carterae.1